MIDGILYPSPQFTLDWLATVYPLSGERPCPPQGAHKKQPALPTSKNSTF
jgi:hypothetical protein